MIPIIKTNRGLIRGIIVFIIVLIVLAYFGFNIRSIVASQTFQDNWSFIKEFASNIWINYIRAVFYFIWENILQPIFRKFS